MRSLLMILDAEDNILAACGESCYDNSTPDTGCICAGTNAGIGIKFAAINLLTFHRTFLQLWHEQNPTTRPATVLFDDQLRQIAGLG